MSDKVCLWENIHYSVTPRYTNTLLVIKLRKKRRSRPISLNVKAQALFYVFKKKTICFDKKNITEITGLCLGLNT